MKGVRYNLLGVISSHKPWLDALCFTTDDSNWALYGFLPGSFQRGGTHSCWNVSNNVDTKVRCQATKNRGETSGVIRVEGLTDKRRQSWVMVHSRVFCWNDWLSQLRINAPLKSTMIGSILLSQSLQSQ